MVCSLNLPVESTLRGAKAKHCRQDLGQGLLGSAHFLERALKRQRVFRTSFQKAPEQQTRQAICQAHWIEPVFSRSTILYI
jgi:hypothetical protein